INRMFKPFVRPFAALGMRGGAASDAMLTLASMPIIFAVAIFLAIASLAGSDVSVPAFFALGVFIADIASRERRAGTLGFVYSAPRLQSRFVLWKLASTLIVAALLMAVPLMHTKSLP